METGKLNGDAADGDAAGSARCIQMVAVLLGVAVITFLLLHYLPADPAALVAGRKR